MFTRRLRDIVRGLLGTYVIEQRLIELGDAIRERNLPCRVEEKTARETRASFEGQGIRVNIRPQDQYPYTYLRIETSHGVFDEPLYYSYLGFGKLVTEYAFSSVLEIGSRMGTTARAFTFLGKDVHTVQIMEDFSANTNGDYLEVKFPQAFDAIWCSHVLEHQRHLGRFCEKMFDDFR